MTLKCSHRTIRYWLEKLKEWHDPDEHLAPPQNEELLAAIDDAITLVLADAPTEVKS